MKVKDIMRREPRSIEVTASLGAAHELMHEHRIRHLPVLQGGRLIGVLSERDILGFRAHLGFTGDWKQGLVSGAMTRSPQTAGPEDSLTEIAGRLAEARIGCLPIVEHGALIGIVTLSDVLAGEVRNAMSR
ncbi:MAG: CBS domain-containing protein [Proteobacteria bacterium]|nr:CBS domain-containing protein [Pseudomonadota bacterium]